MMLSYLPSKLISWPMFHIASLGANFSTTLLNNTSLNDFLIQTRKWISSHVINDIHTNYPLIIKAHAITISGGDTQRLYVHVNT